jgi:hypothetical protein
MRRDQLEHLLRAAGTILRDDQVIVIGSQSILGSFDEDDLPAEIMLSIEADFVPVRDVDNEKSDLIDGAIGEDSMFHETHGIYAQGVDERTATLPSGWRDRLIRYQNANTDGVVGLCLEPHDLCLAKLIANRPKDTRFVRALIDAGIVFVPTLASRLSETECSERQRDVVRDFLTGY